LRDRLWPRLDERIALEVSGLQRRVARQSELVKLLQIIGPG